ncbi:MAG TPA: RNA polymerase sigma-70 factor [Puia sp.]|nr:RNA polymerase sigma-70 factor [Puia sp.]
METTTKNLIAYPVEVAGEAAFEALYRTYFVRLLRFCFSIIHQKESAEEIVNDVFLKLWEHRDRKPAIDNIRLYLYVAVKNRSLNYLRDTANLATIELSERCDPYIRFETNPETILVGHETLQRLRTAINQLPPRCKLIFTLIKEHGLKYKDVAHLLDLSVKTVEAQLAIALRKLATFQDR